MRDLRAHDLDGVVGGTNRTEVKALGVPVYASTQTDRQVCVDAATRLTRSQYPSTRPWWKPWATDANASARATATAANIAAQCGPPATGGGW